MSDEFDEAGFWVKLKRYAQRAGRELVEKTLWLYYAAQSPATPPWARSVIYGALAYFVLPIDAVPDLIPVVGFTDDMGALAAAVATVTMFIDEDVRAQARAKLSSWFDPADTSD